MKTRELTIETKGNAKITLDVLRVAILLRQDSTFHITDKNSGAEYIISVSKEVDK